MVFNAKRARANKRPVHELRELVPDIRYDELDTDDDNEIRRLIDVVSSCYPQTKVAVHGRGDNWTQVDPGSSPYSTSPLVNFAPEFGGRWRGNFPESGDQQINDDGDKNKNTRGTAPEGDFDPVNKKNKINDALDRNTEYVVRITPPPESTTTAEMANELFGEEGEFNAEYVFKKVKTFEEALAIERKFMGRGLQVSVVPLRGEM